MELSETLWLENSCPMAPVPLYREAGGNHPHRTTGPPSLNNRTCFTLQYLVQARKCSVLDKAIICLREAPHIPNAILSLTRISGVLIANTAKFHTIYTNNASRKHAHRINGESLWELAALAARAGVLWAGGVGVGAGARVGAGPGAGTWPDTGEVPGRDTGTDTGTAVVAALLPFAPHTVDTSASDRNASSPGPASSTRRSKALV